MNKQPGPNEVRAARIAAGLTQAEAAELVHLGSHVRWSEYERGVEKISLQTWHLFLLLTRQEPLPRRR